MMAKALTILWPLFVDNMFASALFGSKKEDAPFAGGYQYYDNLGYYKFYSLPTTWVYAWKQCEEDGGHLVVIDSDKEHKVVWNMMKESKEDAYIGAHDIFIEGWFSTVKGTKLLPSSYNRWRDGEPNDGSRSCCVVMNKNGELEDEACSTNFNFICEVELK